MLAYKDLFFSAIRSVKRAVESDKNGDSLFEREHKKIAENLSRVYEGTRPAVLKRFGETDDRGDELICLARNTRAAHTVEQLRSTSSQLANNIGKLGDGLIAERTHRHTQMINICLDEPAQPVSDFIT